MVAKIRQVSFRVSLVLLLGIMPLLPMPALAADHPQPPAYDDSDVDGGPHQRAASQHVEGHIAFLHAELGITPEQESLWKPVADAMRIDVQEMENTERQVAQQNHGHETAVQYLSNRVIFANTRAQSESRFLSAFEPLYNSQSSRQKAAADDLLVSIGATQ